MYLRKYNLINTTAQIMKHFQRPYNLSNEERETIWNVKVKPYLYNEDTCILSPFRRFSYNYKKYEVQHFAYEKYYKDDGIQVDYDGKKFFSTCENKFCINKDHIKNMVVVREWNSKEVLEKIMANSERLEPTEGQEIGCLVWRKAIDNGYGVFNYNGKKYEAHVAAIYAATNNPHRPVDENGEKLIVRHKCTNKACCEPSHLEYGTHQQNNLDDQIRDGTIPRGKNAKITKELAQEIKYSRDSGLTITERAIKFGVSRGNVKSIDYGYAWTHISGPNDEVVNKLVEERKEKRAKMAKDLKKCGLNNEDYKTLLERLQKKLEVKDCGYETPCENWSGATFKTGYPKILYNYRTLTANSVACEIYHGKKPTQDSIVIHKCQNRLCMNKDHIFWGTPFDKKGKAKA